MRNTRVPHRDGHHRGRGPSDGDTPPTRHPSPASTPTPDASHAPDTAAGTPGSSETPVPGSLPELLPRHGSRRPRGMQSGGLQSCPLVPSLEGSQSQRGRARSRDWVSGRRRRDSCRRAARARGSILRVFLSIGSDFGSDSGSDPGTPDCDPAVMDSGPDSATHLDPEVGPPVLTPGAARALLRLLQREHERRTAETATGPEPESREVLAS